MDVKYSAALPHTSGEGVLDGSTGANLTNVSRERGLSGGEQESRRCDVETNNENEWEVERYS